MANNEVTWCYELRIQNKYHITFLQYLVFLSSSKTLKSEPLFNVLDNTLSIDLPHHLQDQTHMRIV